MAVTASHANGTESVQTTPPVPGLWITGLGSQYPPYLLAPEHVEEIAKRFYDVEKPGLKKLLQINRASGIESRAAISKYQSGFASRPEPPSIAELDSYFRQAGVDLAAQACRKAIKEWGGSFSDITHTIAATATGQGTPGYDLLVAQRLGLRPEIDRMLLSGVGCAGGLAIMRAAAQIACGATLRGKPARVLAFACELCTPNVRHDLAEAEACLDPADVSIAGALFADGAASFVLCNDLGRQQYDGDDNDDDDDDDDDDDGRKNRPLFQLLEWGNSTVPATMQHMGFYPEPSGFRTVLTRDVPGFAKTVIGPLFKQLLPSYREKTEAEKLDVPEFDWALHPGGQAIIDGVQEMLDLSEEQLRATRQIYRTRGNSSSPTVLAVLDLLRRMGHGKDHVVAASFGPGLAVEMAFLRRCRVNDAGDDSC